MKLYDIAAIGGGISGATELASTHCIGTRREGGSWRVTLPDRARGRVSQVRAHPGKWDSSGEDVLWRCAKFGLHMSGAQRGRLALRLADGR